MLLVDPVEWQLHISTYLLDLHSWSITHHLWYSLMDHTCWQRVNRHRVCACDTRSRGTGLWVWLQSLGCIWWLHHQILEEGHCQCTQSILKSQMDSHYESCKWIRLVSTYGHISKYSKKESRFSSILKKSLRMQDENSKSVLNFMLRDLFKINITWVQLDSHYIRYIAGSVL